MNPLVPLFAVICLPIVVIALVLATDTGIENSLIFVSVKTFVILGVVAVAMSAAVLKFAPRTRP